jgi:anti-sigma regulatory factor (Ser/Thr protein kinase)
MSLHTQRHLDPLGRGDEFVHEALFYGGMDGFLAGTLPFVREGLAAGEPVLVAVPGEKAAKLRAGLGDAADDVLFADMAELGANPAWIIPAWQDFVSDHGSALRPVRGIGEPIWPERTEDELVECQHHESLLNLAFAGSPRWQLLCPYDIEALPAPVLEEARRSHPYVVEGGRGRKSESFRGLDAIAGPCDLPLTDAPAGIPELAFEASSLATVRARVATAAAEAVLGVRADDLVLAVNEVASNSIRHGGGRGVLRIWQAAHALVCEIRDDGRIDLPLVGRERPANGSQGGRGLWIANQLCDLVQVRTYESGSAVRLHMRPAN